MQYYQRIKLVFSINGIDFPILTLLFYVLIIGAAIFLIKKIFPAIKNIIQSDSTTQNDNKQVQSAQKTVYNPLPKFQVLDSNYGVFTENEKNIVLNLPSDEMTAFANCLEGAKTNKPEEMCYLGLMYNQRLNNPKKSAYWMQKATLAGSINAMYFLGTYYMDGYGVNEDRMIGISLLTCSAQRGNKMAIDTLLEHGMTKEQLRSVYNITV